MAATTKTNNDRRRLVATKGGNGVKGFQKTAAFLVFASLLLASGSCFAGAFVTPGGRGFWSQSPALRRQRQTTVESVSSPLRILSGPPTTGTKPTIAALHAMQQQQRQQIQEEEQQQQQEGDPSDNNNNDGGGDSEVRRLLLDAERLRLEAEKMDANLTLQKIAGLEEKLSNDAWLKKQEGQTVKDLYEELRRLEQKVADPAAGGGGGSSSAAATDGGKPAKTTIIDEESLRKKIAAEAVSEEESPRSESGRADTKHGNNGGSNKPKNPNLPPINGFDEKDLKLYVPIAEDVTKMAPNATLDERIGLFRDAPELQAHFREKIQSLLLGPLEEMQELETLKEQYFDSSSSKEKESLLKQIKRIEANMEENDVGVSVGGGDASGAPGSVGYSSNVLISPDKLPPLTEGELEERYNAIRALPDILVAVYLQRNGLYDLPVAFSTINLEVGNGGIGVKMNTVNNSKTVEDGDSEEETSAGTKDSQAQTTADESEKEAEAPVDLYENLELAIQLDYYDLQLQLLNQAMAIRPMDAETRKDYTMAFRSLPSKVRVRYVSESLGIDTLEKSVVASDEEQDVESVVEAILKPLDEEMSSPWLQLSGAAGSFMDLGGSNKKAEEPEVVPPEYNDVEFIDRSRFLTEFIGSVEGLEEKRPSPEEVDLFVTDCLVGNKDFMMTSKPERVMGGYYVRGTNQMVFDEKTSMTANDRLTREVSKRLQNHPTLKDKIEFYYILDPSPPSDEDMELEVNLNPLFLITGKDPKTLYNLSSPVTKTAVTVSGLLTTFLFSIGSCVLNPKISAGIEKALDSASSSAAGTTVYIDVNWFFELCLPLYFSFLGILFAHELGHRIVASYYKFDIGFPNVIPSLTTGLAGSITPLKSPPPNNKALFDFSIAGPLSGLVVSLGFLYVGLELTRQIGMDANLPVLPVDLARTSSLGGGMVQYYLGKYALLPGQGPGAYVELHPFAISGLIGCTINALALLPLGHTDGGRISLTMFGRRGAFVVKLFTTLILTTAGLIGLDNVNILLAYAVFTLVWQRELESPIRNEVDELDFSRGLLATASAIMVGLVLIPMTS